MSEIINNILYLARRFRLATAFNMLGLIVAFAAFYLMMTQINFQATYNHGIQDYQRIYRLDTDFLNNNKLFSGEVFYPFVQAIESLPEVESVSLAPYIDENSIYASYYQLPFQKQDSSTVKFSCEFGCNMTAVSTLTDKCLSGNIQWTDHDTVPRGIIIPKSAAMEYFGKVNVANDSMMFVYTYADGTKELVPYMIRGVYEDFPKNSELRNYIYVLHDSIETLKYNFDTPFKCYIKFKEVPGDVTVLDMKLKNAVLDMMRQEGWEKYEDNAGMSAVTLKSSIDSMRVKLTPLKDSYFEINSLESGKHGSRTLFNILSLSCLLLIVIAAIHFLNFMLVESPMRIGGINTRLVLGASRRALRLGIIAECVITAVVAAIIALACCWALSHVNMINQLFDGNISLRSHMVLALLTILMAGAAGFAAGLYPAIFATSFVPAMALKGNFGLTRQGHKLRKTLIGLQLFASFLIVTYLGTLFVEYLFIFNSSYHYDHKQVLISTLPINTNDSTKEQLYQELTAIPGIENVSYSDGSMGLADKHGVQLAEIQKHSINFEYTHVDTAYLNTLGIKMLEGRNFIPTDSAAAIINKSAREAWQWLKIGMKIPSLYGPDSLTVVGVCDDIRYNTTRLLSNQPFAFLIQQNATRIHLNVRVAPHTDIETIRYQAHEIIKKRLRETFKPNTREEEISLEQSIRPLITFEDKLKESYEVEFRFFKWIAILSIVSMVITLIGVFCLTLFESEYRRKEIGIRKVAGATTGEIITMLCGQYIPLILISFAAAAPTAYLCWQKTLEHFPEHATINWWIFPLALLLVGGVTLAIILFQSWRTARENPVNSIKSE